jgi:hypothetical protein
MLREISRSNKAVLVGRVRLANMYGDTTTKILDVISTILPSARKIAVLMSSNPTHPGLYELSRTPLDYQPFRLLHQLPPI